VTITVRYSDEDLTAAGGSPENLVLAHYNEATGKWNTHETAVNSVDRTLSATATHLGTWTILAKSPQDGLASWIGIVIGIATVLGVGVVLVKSIAVERLDQAP